MANSCVGLSYEQFEDLGNLAISLNKPQYALITHIYFTEPLSDESKRNFRSFCKALAKNGVLRRVSVPGVPCMHALSKCLAENVSLRWLDLRCALIQDRAVEILGRGLARNASVEVLRLSDNPLTGRGGRAFGKALAAAAPSVSALRRLDFYNASAGRDRGQFLDQMTKAWSDRGLPLPFTEIRADSWTEASLKRLRT